MKTIIKLEIYCKKFGKYIYLGFVWKFSFTEELYMDGEMLDNLTDD